jgi:predicted AlkP superfamily pyrophosphatase or phosphodiesterase
MTMKPAIIVILDGVNHRSYTKLKNLGKLPFIDELSKEGIEIKKCCTVFPSATVSGHASISTAAHPGDHELVGQSWYCRETGEFIGYDFELTLPDNWIDASTNLSDKHLGSVKTGFEVVKEYSIKSFSVDLIRRGADLKFSFITPGYDRDVAKIAEKFMFLRRFARYRSKKGKSLFKKIITRIIPFHTFQNEVAVNNTIQAIKLGCRFGVTWFMETDAASHIFWAGEL